MSIPAGVMRVVIHGSLGASETFETGFWMNSSPSNQADADDVCVVTASNLVTDWGPMMGILSTDSVVLGVKSYCYPTGGPTATIIGSAPVAGVSGTGGTGPNQVCLVATLLTGVAGRRHKGRMYLPANGLPTLVGDHQVSNTVVDNIANAMAVFLNRSPGGTIVLSQVGGTQSVVTQVRVDSKPDIQRRRANKQPAIHSHTATL